MKSFGSSRKKADRRSLFDKSVDQCLQLIGQILILLRLLLNDVGNIGGAFVFPYDGINGLLVLMGDVLHILHIIRNVHNRLA